MLINTVNELNDFIEKSGVSCPEKIIELMSENKIIVSPVVAKLILTPAFFH